MAKKKKQLPYDQEKILLQWKLATQTLLEDIARMEAEIADRKSRRESCNEKSLKRERQSDCEIVL
jgi:hypothetical protein